MVRLPDLLTVQRESFDRFLNEGLGRIFRQISPIEDFSGMLALEISDHEFGPAPLTPGQAKMRGRQLRTPVAGQGPVHQSSNRGDQGAGGVPWGIFR